MQRILAPFIAFITLAMSGPFVRAGLYDPAKPALQVTGPNGVAALPFDEFRDQWDELAQIGVPETRAHKEALATLAVIKKVPNPTSAELIRRGILQLKLRAMDAAFTDFQQAHARNRRDFWALTALGTYYQSTGQFAEAVRYLEAARELMPTDWPTGPAARTAAATMEAAQLKLARLRLGEQGRRAGRPRPAETVDALFDVRFIGPSGQYEAGTIAPAERAKLPGDAIATVQQLLFWIPDERLYWLLGELYNAQGDVDSALVIFNDCLNRRFDAAELRLHRQIVREAIATRPAPPADDGWSLTRTQWIVLAGTVGPVLFILMVLQVREWMRRSRKTRA